ncbi:hypothetical protein I4U23_003634 [Adineta vaga]|nr:hypothetical protein I4U23_003634 [Adineta vaga]
MFLFQIILYFTIISDLLLCLPIETESIVAPDAYFEDVTVSNQTKPKLTLDEFFNYTTFPFMSFSPTGEYLLYQTQRPSLGNTYYTTSLWLYNIKTMETIQITNEFSSTVTPQWSPNGAFIAFVSHYIWLPNSTTILRKKDTSELLLSFLKLFDYRILLYSVQSNQLVSIPIGDDIPNVLTWSHNDSTIYFSQNRYGSSLWQTNVNPSEQKQYVRIATINRLDLEKDNETFVYEINRIVTVYAHIDELLLVPLEDKLVFTNKPSDVSTSQTNEIYSLDLNNSSNVIRLTNNSRKENILKLSNDGSRVLFTVGVVMENNIDYSYQGLYSLDVTNGNITAILEYPKCQLHNYAHRSDGGVYVLSQCRTEIYVATQKSIGEEWVDLNPDWGTYESIASSSNPNCPLAFVHSSSKKPMEIYCANNTFDLTLAKQITNENKLFAERNLPQTKVYNWTNQDDNTVIEGILHYPPDQFQAENLPLFVLIHGGPKYASINKLEPTFFEWATLAASEGWLVLEPNYRGSSGYGDDFMEEIYGKPLSLAGRDILSGIDQLIADGIVDPSRLAVGGCSFGGSLTNWLITQRDDFKAALSCSGAVDHVSAWGLMDSPVFYTVYLNGTPWQMPHLYQNESPIYQLHKVRAPTHICTGDRDKRVPASQSYMLERGIRALEVPVKLLTFSDEAHGFSQPLSGKIKVREELKWLKKYVPDDAN